MNVGFYGVTELSRSSGRECRPVGDVFDSATVNRAVCTFAPDGRVTLAPDLNLDDVRGLPLPYLRMLREIISTAIYDAERGW